jgi:hypothetical protein
VPDGVCVVWAGLFVKPFEVVMVVVCGGRGAPHARVARLADVVIGHGHGPLKVLLALLFAAFDALLGAVGGDVRRRLPVAAQGYLPASLGRAEHDHLVAGGVLGGDVVQLLDHVPAEVAMSI